VDSEQRHHNVSSRDMQCDNDSMTEEVTTSGLQPLQELVGGANSGGDSDCGVGAASTAAAPTMPHFGTNATEATSSELVNAWQRKCHV
jgi:hypothetical protein